MAKRHELLVREFLQDHPEFIPDVRFADVDGDKELVMTGDAVRAFSGWAVAHGHTTAGHVDRLNAAMTEAVKKLSEDK